jgi:hypothetical protein
MTPYVLAVLTFPFWYYLVFLVLFHMEDKTPYRTHRDYFAYMAKWHQENSDWFHEYGLNEAAAAKHWYDSTVCQCLVDRLDRYLNTRWNPFTRLDIGQCPKFWSEL